MKLNLRKTKGVTLIVLVITIIVLIILAGVSIVALTGGNGILTQAEKAKDMTGTAELEEIVYVALTGLVAEKKGETSGITPEMVANEVNRQEGRTDVTAEESAFPTFIVFQKEDKKVGINLELEIATIESYDGIYSEPGLEGKIAPQELFEYEIINEAKTSSIQESSLPTKEAKITRIKPEYCNGQGYNPETNKKDLVDTNYEIIYKGNKITDLLVIPYQVEIDGEMYKITQVDITTLGNEESGVAGKVPQVKTIIYPNTVQKVTSTNIAYDYYDEQITEKIVLPKDLKIIGERAFCGCTNLKNIQIPKSVTNIGKSAFSECTSLTDIVIPEGVTSIEGWTFDRCSNLTNIVIPEGVTSIGEGVFYSCNNLTNITIPASVTQIGDSAFSYCTKLKKINIKKPEGSITGSPWGETSATINWNYTGE